MVETNNLLILFNITEVTNGSIKNDKNNKYWKEEINVK